MQRGVASTVHAKVDANREPQARREAPRRAHSRVPSMEGVRNDRGAQGVGMRDSEPSSSCTFSRTTHYSLVDLSTQDCEDYVIVWGQHVYWAVMVI